MLYSVSRRPFVKVVSVHYTAYSVRMVGIDEHRQHLVLRKYRRGTATDYNTIAFFADFLDNSFFSVLGKLTFGMKRIPYPCHIRIRITA